MARTTFRIEGLKELDEALKEFDRLAARRIGRRVLKKAGEPIASAARNKAPKFEWHLHNSIDVSTKLTRRQRRLTPKPPKTAVEMYVGTANPAGVTQEFGTWRHKAQPFMRPAWDSQKNKALRIIVDMLGVDIEKTAARARRKALKAAKGK